MAVAPRIRIKGLYRLGKLRWEHRMAHKHSKRGGRSYVSESLCLRRMLAKSVESNGQTVGIARSAINPARLATPRRCAEGVDSALDRVTTNRSYARQAPVRIAGLELAFGRPSMLMAWLMGIQSDRQGDDHQKDWTDGQG